MTEAITPDSPEARTTIEIQDLNQFVQMLTAWHSKKVKVLEHMLQIPEGIEMVVDGKDTVILKGEILAGFKAGLNLALMELGSLPFVYESEEVPATEPTPT